MYSDIVLNVFNNPKNAGRISKPDGIADCYNFDNTAHVEFSLRVENGIITKCQFRAQANPYIIAICSTITKMLNGKMVSMVFLDPYSIKKELGDESPYDIEFCIDCVKMAIMDYKEKLEKENKTSKTTISLDEEDVNVLVEQEENEKEETIDSIDEPVVEPKTDVVKEEFEDPDDDFADFFDFLDEE